MITRTQVRRSLVLAGFAAGAVGVLIYIITPIMTIRYDGSMYTVQVGRGAAALFWRSQPATTNIVMPAAAGGGGIRSAPTVTRGQQGIVPQQPRQTIVSGGARTAAQQQPAAVTIQSVTIDGSWNMRTKRLPLYLKPDLQDVGPNSTNGRAVLPAWILVVLGAWCAYLLLPSEVPAGTCAKCRFDISRTPPVPGAPHRVRCPECGHISRRRVDMQNHERSGAAAPPAPST